MTKNLIKALTLILLFAATAFSEVVSTDPSAFLSTITRDYANLIFDAAAKAEIDSMNRQLRERQFEGHGLANARGALFAGAEQDALMGKILEKLGDMEQVVKLTIADDQPLPELPMRELAGDEGIIIFKVGPADAGAARRFTVYEHTLAISDQLPPPRITIDPAAQNWIAFILKEVPQGPKRFLIELAPNGQRTKRLPINVQPLKHCRLKVAVLSDDGEEVPFMVRLTWKTANQDRKVSNAIELADLFEGLGNVTSYRQAVLPGEYAGNYWCVPGPFDMTVPPGEWEIVIRRGLEYSPVRETFSVAPGETAEKNYTLNRWVEMPARGWYSGDVHVHARILSERDAQMVMAWSRAEGVHVANVVEMGDIAGTHFAQRGFGKNYIVAKDGSFLVPGQEDPRTHLELGHVLGLNITDIVHLPEHYFLYDLVYDGIHAQGGLAGYAHVNGNGFHVHRDMSLNMPKGNTDFVEVFQWDYLGTELFYEFLDLGFKQTLTAGSDIPWAGTIGEERVYVYLGDEGFTTDAWFAALKQGRTFVTDGPILDFSVDGHLPGSEIAVEKDQQLRVKARLWTDASQATPERLEIVVNGEVVKTVRPTDGDVQPLEVDFEIESGNGYWIAARGFGTDNSRAHTTPVYVNSGTLRRWNHARAPELIQKRLDDLEQIGRIFTEAGRLYDAKVNVRDAGAWPEADITISQLAEHRTQMRARIDEARQYYEELRKLHQAEKSQR